MSQDEGWNDCIPAPLLLQLTKRSPGFPGPAMRTGDRILLIHLSIMLSSTLATWIEAEYGL